MPQLFARGFGVMMNFNRVIVALMAATLGFDPVFGQDNEADGITIGVVGRALEDVTEIFENANIKLPARSGILAVHVVAYGPAHKAGISDLDIIVKINKTRVSTIDEFKATVSSLDPTKPCSVEGFHAIRAPSGKATWKRGTLKMTPVRRKELYLNAMRTEKDEITGIVKYTHRDSTKFVNSSTEIYCYVLIENGGPPQLRLHVQYVADDWLFVRRLTITADDEKFSVEPSRLEGFETDHSGGKIWEWCNCPVDDGLRSNLLSIVDSRNAVIRFEGDKYNKDVELTVTDQSRLHTVLAVYDILRKDAEAK